MDFATHYTKEQQEFRHEVRAWLDANIPKGFEASLPPDSANQERAQFEWAREFRKKLGAKGWLAPLWPKDLGGGGLSIDQAVVIEEELGERDVPPVGDLGISLAGPAIRAWGTDEQKQRYLPPILKGEHIVWQVFTEPEAGSDLASLRTRAVEDGDDFVINGNKIFVGSKFDAEWLYTLAVTDPTAPRHQNISAFMIPTSAPGLTITHLDLMAGGGKRMIYFEDVRVARENLIGGDTGRGKGWWVAQTTLELEHGGSGRVVARNKTVDQFIEYCKGVTRNGQRLTADPNVQQALADLYVKSHVGRLLGVRNFWMRNTGKKFSYEGSQFSLWGKTFSPYLAQKIMEVAGPFAMVDDPKWAPIHAELENQQRQSLATHPGGTPEVQKIIMSRAMGLSRTPNRTAEMGRTEGAAH
ncbi:MAG: acyl-CoA dehydrogenase family protein [Chloroflexi bacterium]|nr:acyl-CoA dehydrogenase family protein [Chloroflexota bacterium]